MTTTVAKSLAQHSFIAASVPSSACWRRRNGGRVTQHVRVRRRPGGGGGHG